METTATPHFLAPYVRRTFTGSIDAAAKSRSYDVRDLVGAMLGKRPHNDFSCAAPVVVTDWRSGSRRPGVLRSTSNAGFRGIEGRVEFETGETETVSLGWVEVSR